MPVKQTVDLERLTQKQAAWLVSRPASWLRDNRHVDGSNADGTFDGRKLVAALRNDFQPAELPDELLERVMQFADESIVEIRSYATAIRLLETVERSFGAAGLAAVAGEILGMLREYQRNYGERWAAADKSEADLRSEADAWFAEQLKAQSEREARRAGRVVQVCERCNAYRWARRWIKSHPPAGYAIDKTTCPPCELKAG